MTKPSITYGHGWLDDCNKLTGLTYGDWTETDTGGLLSSAVAYDDYFILTRSAGATEAYLSYPDEAGANNLSLSSTTYTKFFYRYLTSGSTKAKIVLVFSDASTQTILAESSASPYTCASVTITTGKTIDHVRLYANTGAGTAQYDFALICKGIFTFPNTLYGKRFIPAPRNAIIEIPSRVGDVIQHLGAKSARFEVSCNLDRGTWTRTGDTVKGQVFDDIIHNSYTEAFQWLTTGMGTTIAEHFYQRQFKVVLDGEPVFREEDNKHILDLVFREYRRSSGSSDESYVSRFGLNL